MKVEHTNVSATILESIREDIESVEKYKEARKQLAGISLVVISLENRNIPVNLPSHRVKKPEPKIPDSFHSRCAREITRQSFQLINTDRRIWVVAGGNEGALYGVQEVLQCLTGVIWAGLEDRDILFGKRKALPAGVQKPLFPFRGRDGGSPNGDNRAFIRWMNRNRWNLWRRNSAYWMSQKECYRKEILQLCASRCIHLTLGDHAMKYFLPEEKFLQHPDWFGYRNGRRVLTDQVVIPDCPHLNAELPIQPCYSNQEAAEFITDRMAEHMMSFPQAEIFGLWPHDGVNNWCQCPRCVEKTPYEHLYHLASLLSEKLPSSTVIELIAYSNLLNLPWKKLQPNERCFTMLCPYLRPYQKRIYQPSGPELTLGTRYPEPDIINPVDEREYGKLFRKWSKVVKETNQGLGIFEYGGSFYDETRRFDRPRYLYHPRVEIRFDEVRWYTRHDVQVFYLCSIFDGWPDIFPQWSLGKILWSLKENPEELSRQYYQALAGKSGTFLREKLRQVQNVLGKEHNPVKQLKLLKEFLLQMPYQKWVNRYLLWIEYVQAGKKSWDYELTGNFTEGAKNEEQIQSFLENNRSELSSYVAVDALIRLSMIHQERFTNWLNGSKGNRYTL